MTDDRHTAGDRTGSAVPATSRVDFESIKRVNPYGVDYWSARELGPLLDYTKWQNFEVAIRRAMIACEQVGQVAAHHFTGASKMVRLGSGAERAITDYSLAGGALTTRLARSRPRPGCG